MRPFAAILLVAAPCLLAGCEATHRVVGAINPDTVSLTDRCVQVVRLAMPFADIDIEKQTSENHGIDRITARVDGVRNDLPKGGALPRGIAVECQFDDNVLTGIRWIEGGPANHDTPPQPPAP
jgi:hypothetical protein